MSLLVSSGDLPRNRHSEERCAAARSSKKNYRRSFSFAPCVIDREHASPAIPWHSRRCVIGPDCPIIPSDPRPPAPSRHSPTRHQSFHGTTSIFGSCFRLRRGAQGARRAREFGPSIRARVVCPIPPARAWTGSVERRGPVVSRSAAPDTGRRRRSLVRLPDVEIGCLTADRLRIGRRSLRTATQPVGPRQKPRRRLHPSYTLLTFARAKTRCASVVCSTSRIV